MGNQVLPLKFLNDRAKCQISIFSTQRINSKVALVSGNSSVYYLTK